MGPPADDNQRVTIEATVRAHLTEAQFGAAVDPAREVLTLACAGSGKSRTLAYRIARLVALGEHPASIVAFTFTEKAAQSIKQRVASALSTVGIPGTVLGAMYIGTIHAYCKEVLGRMDARYRQFEVLDENRLKLYLISRYAQLGLSNLKPRANNRYFEVIRQVSNGWKTLNDELLSISAVALQDPPLAEALQRVADGTRADHFMDFSLMVRRVAEGLRDQDDGAIRAISPVRHLMVDEYQDINPAQELLIRQMHDRSATLFVVGDDDQAIYAWRGADVNNILTFRARYAECSSHTLSHNFRSTPAIVGAADRFAAQELGALRMAKHPLADEPEGARDFRTLWFPTRADEAAWVAGRIHTLLGTRYVDRGKARGLTPGDFAILMRSTRMPDPNGEPPRHTPFTRELEAQGIPFSLDAGGSVFDDPHVSALCATFELLRYTTPTREQAQDHFRDVVQPAFPAADFEQMAAVLSDWGRNIHAPIQPGLPRRRVYPQRLVHELLAAFGSARGALQDRTLEGLGVFSRIIQDVEAVYLSIDSPGRFQDVLNFLQNVGATGYDSATDEVVRRPDLVTVSTVHKVKGLEFPVVFVVDVEAGRFPKNRGSYDGWLPAGLMSDALARGAYQSTPQEEARLFYTAATRGERFLYVSGAARLPGGKKPSGVSRFMAGLSHPEISRDPQGLPTNLLQEPPRPRVDEAVVPTSYSEVKYYLSCPWDYKLRKVFGFSPPIPDLFGFGLTVHTAVGKLHERFRDSVPTPQEAESVAREVFHLKHVPPSRDPVNRPGAYENARESAARVTRDYAAAYRADFLQEREVEARFEIPVNGAVISGAIDLLLRLDSEGNVLEARVVDFKAMEGGPQAQERTDLNWTDLSLQVQLYARAAREVLGENTRTGAVHLLKDNQRIEVPVATEAVAAAVANVEWAVQHILAGDFPMRPHAGKCPACDFRAICPKTPQAFSTTEEPPPIRTPGGQAMVRAFAEYEGARG